MDCLELQLDLNAEATSAEGSKSSSTRRSLTTIPKRLRSATPGTPKETAKTSRITRIKSKERTPLPAESNTPSVSNCTTPKSTDFVQPRARQKTKRGYSPDPVFLNKRKTAKVKFSDFGKNLRKQLCDSAVDFSLPEFMEKTLKPQKAKKIKRTEEKEEEFEKVVKEHVEDSDDEEETEGKPIVRMSDIGAAPFMPPPRLSQRFKSPKSSKSTPDRRKSAATSFKFRFPTTTTSKKKSARTASAKNDTESEEDEPMLDNIVRHSEEPEPEVLEKEESVPEEQDPEVKEETPSEKKEKRIRRKEEGRKAEEPAKKETVKRKSGKKDPEKEESEEKIVPKVAEKKAIPKKSEKKEPENKPTVKEPEKKVSRKESEKQVPVKEQEKKVIVKDEEEDFLSTFSPSLSAVANVRRSGRPSVRTEKMKELKEAKPASSASREKSLPTEKSPNPSSALAIRQKIRKSIGPESRARGRKSRQMSHEPSVGPNEDKPETSSVSSPTRAGKKTAVPTEEVSTKSQTPEPSPPSSAEDLPSSEPDHPSLSPKAASPLHESSSLDSTLAEETVEAVETNKEKTKSPARKSKRKSKSAKSKPEVEEEQKPPTEESEEKDVPEETLKEGTPSPADPSEKPVETSVEVEKKSSKPKSTTRTPVLNVAPVRSSGRVSKPNRKFDEEYFLDGPAVHKSAPAPSVSPQKVEETDKVDTGNAEDATSKTLPGKIRFKLKFPKVENKEIVIETDPPMDDDSSDNVERLAGGSEKTDEPGPSTSKSKKKLQSDYLSRAILPGYQPSWKPVLGHFRKPDGSWENLGISVGAVLDRLLLQVCNDGITRHSSIMSNKERKRRAICIIKSKYEEKKLEAELKGVHVQDLPKLRQNQVVMEPRKRRREAPTKHSDDFLYPSLKREKREEIAEGSHSKSSSPAVFHDDETAARVSKAESRESKSHRKSLDYLSKHFNREMDAAIRDAHIDYDSCRRKTPLDSSDEASDNAPNFWKEEKKEPKKKKRKEKRETIKMRDYLRMRGFDGETNAGGIRLMNEPEHVDDVFFREFLTDAPTDEVQSDTENDEFLDIMDDVDEFAKFGMLPSDPRLKTGSLAQMHREANEVAEKIAAAIPRPSNIDGSNYTVGDMYQKTSEQPEMHRAVFDSALNVITEQYVVDCTPMSSTDGDVLKNDIVLYNKTTFNATQLKSAFTMFDVERQESVYWVHKFFLECLPTHFLSAYLVLLKYAKPMTSSYTGLLTKSTIEDVPPWPEVTQLVCSYVSVKPVDPELDSLNSTVAVRSLSDVVFLLVSPTMSVGEFVFKARYHETIFKWLKQIGNSQSEIIRLREDEDEEDASIADVCELLVNIVCDKVREKAKQLPDARIVLVGWGFTTYVIHRVVQLVHCVSAIIDFAFPVMSDLGRRGTADDDFLLTYCPTLLVVGAEGERYDAFAVKDLRSSMLNTTGLVVVGHANDNLLVSKHALLCVGITQKVIFRLLLEQVLDFLKLDDTFKERTQLCPLDLNNVISVDSSLFKGDKPPQLTIPSATPSPISGAISSRRATICGEDFGAKKKKKDIARPAPSPRALKNPPLGLQLSSPSSFPVVPLSADAARSRFDLLMKKASIPDDMQRRVEKRPQVEKGDLREVRMNQSPAFSSVPASQQYHLPPPQQLPPPPPPPPQTGPLDPASISLN
ncbi:unnamed protein product [Caenorhabditis auriculariae]|uniref:KANSL3 helical domain-containing protein n=1 Tax=Caenorhabditis auriculariae TaxID=2777116 RepID=A0A8S1GV75_9PELO|nr:unnamed protein product [Caenorhabditis auriculariae]